VLFFHIFLAAPEENPTRSQISTPLKMRAGQISNEIDVEPFDIMLTQFLLFEKSLVACLIELNSTVDPFVITPHRK